MKNSKHVSDYMLERFILEELPTKEMRAIEKTIEQNPEVKKRVASLKKSNRDILKAYPKKDIVADIQRKMAIESDLAAKHAGKKNKMSFQSLFRKWFFFPSLAASAALIIFALAMLLSNKHNNNKKHVAKDGNSKKQTEIIKNKNEQKTDLIDRNKKPIRLAHNTKPYYGIKGFKTEIIVHRKSDSAIETLANGAVAHQNDLIQLAYKLQKKSYGVIISIDGRGSVTVHHPLGKAYAKQLTAGRKVNLPTAFELDDAPHFERFFLVTSTKKFSIQYVLNAAKRLAENPQNVKKRNLPLASSLKQVSVMIVKGK